jgi:hypothetical protein
VCERARTALGEFDVECITHITVEILANIGDAARRPLDNNILNGVAGPLSFASSSTPAVRCAVMRWRMA